MCSSGEGFVVKRCPNLLLAKYDDWFHMGVYCTSIDSQQHKVIVSGNISSEILVKKLLKTGKHVAIWNEKSGENAEDKSIITNCY